jgi:hypothetical protein
LVDGEGELLGSVECYRSPPATQAEAALLRDSRTWTAEQGCYVNLRGHYAQNSGFAPHCANIFATQDTDSTLPNAVGVGLHSRYLAVGAQATMSATGVNSDSDGFRKFESDTVGVYFTGLSRETVLTLSTKFLVEVAPTQANPAMLTVATPAAGPDPMALQCYTHCLTRLPPGVPVDMNERGDWFRMVKNVLSEVIPVAGTAIGAATGIPVLGIAGSLAGKAIKNLPDIKQKSTGKTQTTGVHEQSLRKAPKTVVVKRKP